MREKSCSDDSVNTYDDDCDVKDDIDTAGTNATEAVDGVVECGVAIYSNDSNEELSDDSIEDARRVIERTVLNFFKTFEDEYEIEVKSLDCDDMTVSETYGRLSKFEQKIRVKYRQKGDGETFAKVFLEKSRSEETNCFSTEALIDGEMIDLYYKNMDIWAME